MRVGILISGSGSNMVALVRAMQSGAVAATPALVLSNVVDAPGLEKARDLGVPIAQVAHGDFEDRAAFEASVTAALEAAQVELVCLAGFMRILTTDFVQRWAGKMLNIHPSLLPAFKGLHTHERALDAGCAVHGATVHIVTPDLDDGPILGQALVPVHSGDDPKALAARVLGVEHALYTAVLGRFVAGEKGPFLMSGGIGETAPGQNA